MATREYKIVYTVDSAKALAEIAKIEARLRRLDKATDTSRAKLIAMARAATPGMARMSKAIEELMLVLRQFGVRTDRTRQKVQALGGQATRTGQQVRGLGTATAQAGTTAQAASGKFNALRISLKALGIALVIRTIHTLSQALKDAREYAQDTANANHNLYDSLRELASLKGDPGVTKQLVGEELDLMVKTGATAEEAKNFNTLWESTIFAARDMKTAGGQKTWQLTPKQEEEAKVKMLQLAISNGVDPTLMARMVPTIGIAQTITSVDQLVGEVAATHQMDKESVGTFNQLYKEAPGLMSGYVRPEGGGAAKSTSELIGYLSAATSVEKNPALAARAIDQVMREANRESGRKRGFGPKSDFIDALDMFEKVINEGAAKGLGEQASLESAGFRSRFTNVHIARFVRIKGLFKQQKEDAAKANDPALMDAQIKKFYLENPNRLAEASRAAKDTIRGQEEMTLTSLRSGAEARMGVNHQIDMPGSNFAEGMLDWTVGLAGAAPARTLRENQNVIENLAKEVPGLSDRFRGFGQKNLYMQANPSFQEKKTGKWFKLSEIADEVKATNPEIIQRLSQPPEVQAQINAMRAAQVPAGQAAPAAPGVAPKAPGAGAAPGPQASLNLDAMLPMLSEIATASKQQVAVLNRIGRGGPGGNLAFNPNVGPYRPGSDV